MKWTHPLKLCVDSVKCPLWLVTIVSEEKNQAAAVSEKGLKNKRHLLNVKSMNLTTVNNCMHQLD